MTKRVVIILMAAMLATAAWAEEEEVVRCVCPLTCPSGAIVETETCGSQSDSNGGCTTTPRLFEDISCPSTICGTVRVKTTHPEFYDDDWYRVTLTGTETDSVRLVWRVVAEFGVRIKIIRPGTGADPCSGRLTLRDLTIAACDTAEVSVCVVPGVYYLEVKPSSTSSSISCDNGDYIAWVTCLPCHPEPPFTDVDMGDLPMCDYPTLTNNPGHVLSGIAWLGPNVSPETAPALNDGDLYDDGVPLLVSEGLRWEPCHRESVSVIVTGGQRYDQYARAGGLLFLNAWKDGNTDDDFCDTLCGGDAPEWFLQNKQVVADSTYGFWVLDPGLEGVPSYRGIFRFRLTHDSLDQFGFGLIDSSSCPNMYCGTKGLDTLGEVEDYVIEDFQLAVEMGTFDAIPGDNRITLRWNTLSESNNDRFDIERDGAVVARPRGLGDSPSGHSYQWVDEQVQSAVTYTYKLYSVDLNGTRRALATVSAAPNSSPAAVTEYALNQNYPNPFNPTTQITFDLVENGQVTLTIFNPVGQLVTTLVNGPMTAGRHTIAFDAGNLPTGMYLYRLEAGSFTAARKMLLIK
ncbi:MAG: T9SS type A sorting domain-containing protein [bacterium]|nr:T9SS type A sorting domain-containing protein [bacterium]